MVASATTETASSSPSPPVTHIIFDFDGLLVDTEPAYTEANDQVLKKHGSRFTMELKAGMMGRKQRESVEWILEQVNLAGKVKVDEYIADYDMVLEELFGKAPACRGAEALVRALKKKGIPMAICSGSSSKDFPPKAANHRSWIDLIDFFVLTGDDPQVKRGKPFPDGFLETMKRFPVPPTSPSNVLVLEDAPNGVKAALAAGMRCVQVPDPHPAFQVDEETRKKITVLTSLEEFKPTDFGLPLLD